MRTLLFLFSSLLSFLLFYRCLLSFSFVRRSMGSRRRCETPTITAQAGPGAGKGYTVGKGS